MSQIQDQSINVTISQRAILHYLIEIQTCRSPWSSHSCHACWCMGKHCLPSLSSCTGRGEACWLVCFPFGNEKLFSGVVAVASWAPQGHGRNYWTPVEWRSELARGSSRCCNHKEIHKRWIKDESAIAEQHRGEREREREMEHRALLCRERERYHLIFNLSSDSAPWLTLPLLIPLCQQIM